MTMTDEAKRPAGFLTFLSAFTSDWFTAMCGVPTVPFAVLALFFPGKLRFLWVCLAIVCGGYSSFRVWRKERIETNKLISELQADAHELRASTHRDWAGDWRLVEDGFRRHSQSSVRADWQSISFSGQEGWTICGDQPFIVQEVRAFCFQAGKLLVASPLHDLLPKEVMSQTNDLERWLTFIKSRHALTNMHVESGFETVEGKTYAVSIGSINMLAAVSATACVECAALALS